MKELPSDRLELLSMLANEYDKKYREVEEIARTADLEKLPYQLKLRGELTTDRFRGAQQFLLNTLKAGEEKDEQTLKALVTLIRCFDEMRILFEILYEHGGDRP
jgi:hypothetical protein